VGEAKILRMPWEIIKGKEHVGGSRPLLTWSSPQHRGLLDPSVSPKSAAELSTPPHGSDSNTLTMGITVIVTVTKIITCRIFEFYVVPSLRLSFQGTPLSVNRSEHNNQ
jgi:hypothetical protein